MIVTACPLCYSPSYQTVALFINPLELYCVVFIFLILILFMSLWSHWTRLFICTLTHFSHCSPPRLGNLSGGVFVFSDWNIFGNTSRFMLTVQPSIQSVIHQSGEPAGLHPSSSHTASNIYSSIHPFWQHTGRPHVYSSILQSINLITH